MVDVVVGDVKILRRCALHRLLPHVLLFILSAGSGVLLTMSFTPMSFRSRAGDERDNLDEGEVTLVRILVALP